MSGTTVWVIHSEDSWRQGIAKLLTAHGFTVTEQLVNKNEAVDKLNDGSVPNPGLITTDALGAQDELTIEKLATHLNGKGIGHVVLSLASTKPIEESLAKFARYTSPRFMRKGAVEFNADTFDVERLLALAYESMIDAQKARTA